MDMGACAGSEFATILRRGRLATMRGTMAGAAHPRPTGWGASSSGAPLRTDAPGGSYERVFLRGARLLPIRAGGA